MINASLLENAEPTSARRDTAHLPRGMSGPFVLSVCFGVDILSLMGRQRQLPELPGSMRMPS